MHDRVDAVEQFGGKLADVAEHLPVEQGLGQELRAGQAVAKKAGVEANQLRVFRCCAQKARQNRSDIAHIAGNQYPHSRSVSRFTRVFHGALPEAHRVLQMAFVAQRIHRLPEAVVEIDAELAFRREPLHRLLLPDRGVALDVVARPRGDRTKKPPLIQPPSPDRLLLESGDSVPW